DVDITDAGYSIDQHKLLFAGFETSRKERHYLDDSIKSIYAAIGKSLPNSEVRITSRDSSERRLIVRTVTDKSPGAFYFYSLDSNKLVKLSDINPSLPADQMCDMKPVSFKSRDG